MSSGSTRWSLLGEGTDTRRRGLRLLMGVFAAPCPKCSMEIDPNQSTPTPEVAALPRVPQAAHSAATSPCDLLGAWGERRCCDPRCRRRRFGAARVRCCCAQH